MIIMLQVWSIKCKCCNTSLATGTIAHHNVVLLPLLHTIIHYEIERRAQGSLMRSVSTVPLHCYSKAQQ